MTRARCVRSILDTFGVAIDIELGDGVQVGVSSAVHSSVPAGEKVTGVPAIAHRKWLRAASGFSELPELVKPA